MSKCEYYDKSSLVSLLPIMELGLQCVAYYDDDEIFPLKILYTSCNEE